MVDVYIVDPKNIIDNLYHSNIEQINSFFKKIKFYNPKINEPLHKFWYNINNAKIIKKNANNLEIALPQNDANLINSINNLDDLINNKLKDFDNNYICNKTIITNKNYPPYIILNIDNTTKFYNNENIQINYIDLENENKVNLYIEFDCVIINSLNNKVCSKKWKILQLKKINSLLDNNLNFFENKIIQNIPPPPQLPPPSNIIQPSLILQQPQLLKSVVNQEKPKDFSRNIINIHDIKNALGNLKKKPEIIIKEEKANLPFLKELCSMKNKLKKPEKNYNILFDDLINKYKDLNNF